MTTAALIEEEMNALFDEKQSRHLAGFFKTGKGEYGEGDKFLGIKVPVTRSIVKKYRDKVSLEDIKTLIASHWHEIRLAGFLFLVNLYYNSQKKKDFAESRKLVEFYIANIAKSNNWDLVDLVSEHILGDWVCRNPESENILIKLASRNGCLWHQRVAIVSTFALIRAGRFDMTLRIAENYLTHPHDLIHKATGWMLREIGKRGGKERLVEFLVKHKAHMPRTLLRYAIERFPAEERKELMKK